MEIADATGPYRVTPSVPGARLPRLSRDAPTRMEPTRPMTRHSTRFVGSAGTGEATGRIDPDRPWRVPPTAEGSGPEPTRGRCARPDGPALVRGIDAQVAGARSPPGLPDVRPTDGRWPRRPGPPRRPPPEKIAAPASKSVARGRSSNRLKRVLGRPGRSNSGVRPSYVLKWRCLAAMVDGCEPGGSPTCATGS